MFIDPNTHVTHQVEAYLDDLLSAAERHQVERHLSICSRCNEYLLKARRLDRELGPAMRVALGQPVPPAALRHRVRQRLAAERASSAATWHWLRPGRLLNAAGTLAVVTLLAAGVLLVIQSQIPGASFLSEVASLRPGQDGGIIPTASVTETPVPQALATTTPATISSKGDILPKPPFLPASGPESAPAPATSPELMEELPARDPAMMPTAGTGPSDEVPLLPGGTIAFAFFNPAPGRQTYETHLISPDGTNHRLFPLDGVSEPALHRLDDDTYRLAYRAWSEPTAPRSLLSSNLAGDRPDLVGGFWEDAQPDWSPIEDRLIFASQREIDRRWRLYTVWGDGSAEVNLRREGKSPTFAPDGYRFAFESCDETGNRCGLWLGSLGDSEHGSRPFLLDPLAQSPDWSPVTEEIAYMANPDNNWDLYIVNSDGSDPRQVTDDLAIDGLPAWSPDGEWLAFLSNRGSNWGIWLIHPASGRLHQVYRFDGGTFEPPAGEPYGQRSWRDEQISWSN